MAVALHNLSSILYVYESDHNIWNLMHDYNNIIYVDSPGKHIIMQLHACSHELWVFKTLTSLYWPEAL